MQAKWGDLLNSRGRWVGELKTTHMLDVIRQRLETQIIPEFDG